uniref:Uncharacterized protein n=1 Tax=Oryza nivara TaxID=4536 RepID=A0A0E0ILX4_ORYNI
MAPASSKDTASDVDKDGHCSIHGSGNGGRAERRWATVAGDASLRCIEGGDDERHLVTPTPIVVASTELRLAMPAALKMLGSYSTTASKPVRCWKK